MFAEQRAIETPEENIKTGTFLDNPNIVDVTAQYIKTRDITIKLSKIKKKTFPMAYLCVFNDRRWKPVAKATIEEGAVKFKGVGRENIYTAFYFNKGKWIPASPAFSLDNKGNMSFHVPDTEMTRRVYLERKAKLTKLVKHFGSKMIGGSFQLSNEPDLRTLKRFTVSPKTILLSYLEPSISTLKKPIVTLDTKVKSIDLPKLPKCNGFPERIRFREP